MGTERRCASVHRASTAFGILLTLAASLHVCNGDSNALRDTLREKAGVELAESGQSLETSFPSNYRRQLTRADFEEIKIKKGLYDGETLNSDDFKIVFRVGDGIGDEIRCLIVRSPEEVVANIVPCTSPLKLKGRLAADGQYGVGIYGTALSTGETIEVNSIWHLDRVPPNTLLTADPKDAGETNIEFRFMGFDQTETEEHSQITYQCSLDNERWATCTSPKTVSVTDPGLHNFRVRAVDLAGNHDPYPDVYEWRIAGNPSPSPSPILASPSASPSPSVVPSPSPSVIPSPSPSVVPSPSPSVVPSPSPSVVPSPSPSPTASPVPINAAERDSSGTESSEIVTTLSDEESSSGTVDSSLNGNVAIDRGSSDSDRRVTNEIIAAVVVIPCIVIIIGGAFILKKQVEVHQQLEEEAMAKAGVIKAKEASFHEPTYKDEETPRSYSERSYSERSLSEKSMSE